MRNILKLTTTATAAVLAFSGIASAADVLTGYQEEDGYITQSNCSSVSPSLAVGSPIDAWFRYPGAGKTGFVTASPNTSSTGSAGSATTAVCTTPTAIPSTGLNGATVTFTCYLDKASGPASSSSGQIKETFKVGASHSAQVKQVTTTSTIIVGGTSLCSFTSDGTWTAE
jgi:hypothetical protein